MAEVKLNLASTHSTISQLQGTCNAHERRQKAKLKSLVAGRDPDGVRATEATFEKFDGDREELGKAVVTSGGTKHTAFINNVSVNVQISRS
jgi:hypothetical protein